LAKGLVARVRGRAAVLVTVAVLAGVASPAAQAGVTWRSEAGSSAGDSGKVDPGLSRVSETPAAVIVQATPGQMDGAIAAVEAAGGQVGTLLPIVDGFAATVAGTALDQVAASPDVVAVTADRVGHFESFSYDLTTTASNFTRTSGATQAWAQGKLGDGIGVAVIDTGVSSMNDLSGRIVFSPDLSGEGTTIDSYGHGTVMAGIIGGSGADSSGRTGGAFTGVAPHATIVSVKTAGRNGAVDVSTILQAMHWVAAYKDQYNIRVLNLAWGTPSTQSPSVDPLDYAVQRLWQLGIVVVVAAGNGGPNAGTITKPGDDPVVITTGAYDDKQNSDPSDDSLSPWSSRGPTAAGAVKPDLVSPGRTLVATRSFGSYVEQNNPKALISPSYIKGSGTSEATAVTTGLVALLLQANPGLTPDQVKAVLRNTASPIPNVANTSQGAGRVQLGAALTAAANPGAASWQTLSAGGLGSIEASRGGMDVQTDCNGDGVMETIQGEIDVRCQPWDPAAWTGAAWTGAAWTGAAWTGAAWTGAAWTGAAWTGGTWTGGSWYGAAWTGAAWTGAAWTGAAWTGAAWTGVAWTGAAWTSALYDLLTMFLTAFWGDHPRWNQHVYGEVSDPPPPPPAPPASPPLPATVHSRLWLVLSNGVSWWL
jgi:serine protease AprX